MLTPGYTLRYGTGLDRALLVKFMQHTYRELYPAQNFAHLAYTVEQYFSAETPLWWVDQIPHNPALSDSSSDLPLPLSGFPSLELPTSVACLWLGMAIDQVTGWRYPHIFLLYVKPTHRRQGIGSALMQQAETWARARGDHQIGLQVFQHNQPALQLYTKLGYQPQALSMVKPIERDS